MSAVANVDDYGGSARLLAATTLRNILGTKTLGDILSDRESIAREMQLVLDEGTEPWGVQVQRSSKKCNQIQYNDLSYRSQTTLDKCLEFTQ